MRRKQKRTQSGAEIPEFAAAIAIVVPIFVLIIYMTYEASMYMYLKTGVDAAARTEARWLAINFNYFVQQNGNSATNYAGWKNSNVRVANCVISNSQFQNGTIDSSGNFVATAPPVIANGQCLNGAGGQGVVAVQVLYPGGSGLHSWPTPALSLFGVSLTPANTTIGAIYVADIEP